MSRTMVPQPGARRIVSRFLWTALTLAVDDPSEVARGRYETRHWEQARIVQHWGCTYDTDYHWMDWMWAPEAD